MGLIVGSAVGLLDGIDVVGRRVGDSVSAGFPEGL